MKERGVIPTVFVAMAALLAVPLHCPRSCAQQAIAVPHSKQVLGFENVKPNKKGTLSVDKGRLHGAIFTTPQSKAEDIKKELVAEGAKTSIPTEPPAATPQKEAPKQ